MVIFRESLSMMSDPEFLRQQAENNTRKRRESIRRGDISLKNLDFSGLI